MRLNLENSLSLKGNKKEPKKLLSDSLKLIVKVSGNLRLKIKMILNSLVLNLLNL